MRFLFVLVLAVVSAGAGVDCTLDVFAPTAVEVTIRPVDVNWIKESHVAFTYGNGYTVTATTKAAPRKPPGPGRMRDNLLLMLGNPALDVPLLHDYVGQLAGPGRNPLDWLTPEKIQRLSGTDLEKLHDCFERAFDLQSVLIKLANHERARLYLAATDPRYADFAREHGLVAENYATAFQLDDAPRQPWLKDGYLAGEFVKFCLRPEMKEKILYGERKPAKPKEVRGAHSADVLNRPDDYQILENTENPNGTRNVKLKKRLGVKVDGTAEWSKAKPSTLAPADWNEDDIVVASNFVLLHGAVTRNPDGSETRRWRVKKIAGGHIISPQSDALVYEKAGVDWFENSVEWVVITEHGKITASYPTGQ